MSPSKATHVDKTFRTTLDAWLVQGTDRLDPVRFHFIAALERRAETQSGVARRLLDKRLSQLIAAYADNLERHPCDDKAETSTSAQSSTRSALADLIDDIARRTISSGEHRSVDASPSSADLPELEVLDDFRKIWSKIRTDSQLRHSLAEVPENAGPLNSGNLVHRSLTLMRELSPGYLQHFLSYVDSLSWIEQINHGGNAAGKKTTRTGSTSKRKRSKPA